MTQQLYTLKEVAQILNYPSYDAVRMAVRRGKIRAVIRAGDTKRYFVTRDELRRIIEQSKTNNWGNYGFECKNTE